MHKEQDYVRTLSGEVRCRIVVSVVISICVIELSVAVLFFHVVVLILLVVIL